MQITPTLFIPNVNNIMLRFTSNAVLHYSRWLTHFHGDTQNLIMYIYKNLLYQYMPGSYFVSAPTFSFYREEFKICELFFLMLPNGTAYLPWAKTQNILFKRYTFLCLEKIFYAVWIKFLDSLRKRFYLLYQKLGVLFFIVIISIRVKI